MERMITALFIDQ